MKKQEEELFENAIKSLEATASSTGVHLQLESVAASQPARLPV